jgi:hypothetical protein
MEYPNSGALFPRQKRTDKAPDWGGEIVMEKSLIKQLMQESEGDGVLIKLSGWVRQGSRGEFISLKYDSFKPQPQERERQIDEPTRRAPPPPIDDIDDIPF